MSMQYIRREYKVPAKRGAVVEYIGDPTNTRRGVIVGSRGPRLRVRLAGDKDPVTLHPTRELRYL